MERNVMGELNMYRQAGAKPNFSAGGRRQRRPPFWIGNTYLDDFGRDSPASLNSTGDM